MNKFIEIVTNKKSLGGFIGGITASFVLFSTCIMEIPQMIQWVINPTSKDVKVQRGLSDPLKECVRELGEYEQKVDELKGKLEKKDDEIRAMEKKIGEETKTTDSLKDEVERLKGTNKDTNEHKMKLENELNTKNQEVSKLQSTIDKIRMQMKQDQNDCQYLEQELSKTKTKLVDVENENKYYNEQIKLLQDKIEHLKNISKKDKPPEGKKVLYFHEDTFYAGGSFTDPRTKVVLGVSNIDTSNRATITLTLPGKKPSSDKYTSGQIWEYLYNEIKYRLTLTEVKWRGDSIRVSVQELEQ